VLALRQNAMPASNDCQPPQLLDSPFGTSERIMLGKGGMIGGGRWKEVSS
jgi:hypothetical protein